MRILLLLVLAIHICAEEGDSAVAVVRAASEALNDNDFDKFKALVHSESYYGRDENTKKTFFDRERSIHVVIEELTYVGKGKGGQYVEMKEHHDWDGKRITQFRIITLKDEGGQTKIVSTDFSGRSSEVKLPKRPN